MAFEATKSKGEEAALKRDFEVVALRLFWITIGQEFGLGGLAELVADGADWDKSLVVDVLVNNVPATWLGVTNGADVENMIVFNVL